MKLALHSKIKDRLKKLMTPLLIAYTQQLNLQIKSKRLFKKSYCLSLANVHENQYNIFKDYYFLSSFTIQIICGYPADCVCLVVMCNVCVCKVCAANFL